jgi:hypothetical protein
MESESSALAMEILEMAGSIHRNVLLTLINVHGWKALEELARKPFAIGSKRQLSFPK